MRLPPLVKGTLLQRRQRFLADVRLASGEQVTAHCPNTGSMRGCNEPGRPVLLSVHANPRRKLPYTWELIELEPTLVGINTMNTNRIVREALQSRAIEKYRAYDRIKSEVKISDATRLDFLLQGPKEPPCYMEVKNCTLVRSKTAGFPDAVSRRGAKHLHELIALRRAGNRAAVLFLVQRTDALRFRPAADIDPDYAGWLHTAYHEGVELVCYDVRFDLPSITINEPLPVEIGAAKEGNGA
jgi:sugar fermentation stimulation protein A